MGTNKKDKKNIQDKKLSKFEKWIYSVVIAVLVIAITLVSILVLYPKLAGRPDWHVKAFFDLDNEKWIEEMVERRIKPTGKILDMTSSFVYSQDTAFINMVYGSQSTLSEAREYYLEALPGSVDYDEGSVSGMDIRGSINGEDIEIKNYQADILNAFDTKIIIDSEMAAFLREKIEEAFPEEFVAGYPEFLNLIMNSELLGGYVKYNDDELSSSSYVGVPIYSRAYRYNGTKDDLVAMQTSLKEQFPNSLYFEDIDTVYFLDNGHIISLAITESDFNVLGVITVQEIPEDELAGTGEND